MLMECAAYIISPGRVVRHRSRQSDLRPLQQRTQQLFYFHSIFHAAAEVSATSKVRGVCDAAPGADITRGGCGGEMDAFLRLLWVGRARSRCILREGNEPKRERAPVNSACGFPPFVPSNAEQKSELNPLDWESKEMKLRKEIDRQPSWDERATDIKRRHYAGEFKSAMQANAISTQQPSGKLLLRARWISFQLRVRLAAHNWLFWLRASAPGIRLIAAWKMEPFQAAWFISIK